MKDPQSLSSTDNPRKYYYKGDVATQYDKERAAEEKWKTELDVVRQIVATFDVGASILDVPLGTGRFLSSYEQNGLRNVVGIDISQDMLLQARQKNSEDLGQNQVWMIVGDAEHLPIKDHSVDYVVCIRFLNWLSGAHFDTVLAECRRVARRGLIVGVRIYCGLRPSNFMRLRGPYIKPARDHLFRSAGFALLRSMARIGNLDFSSKRKALEVEAPPYDNEANEFKFHGEQYVLDRFVKNGLKISKKFSFDVRWDNRTKRVLPYTLYFLEL